MSNTSNGYPSNPPPPAYTDFQVGDRLKATLWNGIFEGVVLEVRQISLTLRLDDGQEWCIHRQVLQRLDDGFQISLH